MIADRRALLILFDVDGTLLAGATEAHRDALYAALREVHGVDSRATGRSLSVAGRTDGEIVRLILLDAGVSAERIDDRREVVREVCCREYARRCPRDLSHTVLPGVRELLAWLTARDDVKLSLLTGNYEPVARLKLARAKIGVHFPAGQGAFGSDHEDRAALPHLARRRAGSGDVSHPRGRTIVTGDTPRDIACAHADELRCYAVATGPFDVAALRDADAVASDANELRCLLAAELTAAESGTASAS